MTRTKIANYSVIMSVYKKDNAEWLTQSIESLVCQTIKSDDIVVVADGVLTEQLDIVLNEYEKRSIVTLVRLPENKGLGNALNVGLRTAKNNLVARMDADDISIPNRCELQLDAFARNPDLEILGGQIAEFKDTPDTIISTRNVPTEHGEIYKFSKRRSPFNHPSVMYKKSSILRLGGYDISAIRTEDYDLWLRALAANLECGNLSETILYYRSTADTMKRRKTYTSFRNHINSRRKFYSNGYIALTDLMFGVVTQTLLFILPDSIASFVFKKAVRNG